MRKCPEPLEIKIPNNFRVHDNNVIQCFFHFANGAVESNRIAHDKPPKLRGTFGEPYRMVHAAYGNNERRRNVRRDYLLESPLKVTRRKVGFVLIRNDALGREKVARIVIDSGSREDCVSPFKPPKGNCNRALNHLRRGTCGEPHGNGLALKRAKRELFTRIQFQRDTGKQCRLLLKRPVFDAQCLYAEKIRPHEKLALNIKIVSHINLGNGCVHAIAFGNSSAGVGFHRKPHGKLSPFQSEIESVPDNLVNATAFNQNGSVGTNVELRLPRPGALWIVVVRKRRNRICSGKKSRGEKEKQNRESSHEENPIVFLNNVQPRDPSPYATLTPTVSALLLLQ